MFNNNLKLAIQSLSTTKWRTFLTMLGVIIGVLSVTVIVSIGIGIRQQITNQIQELGPDLITVIPGQSQLVGSSNFLRKINVLPTLGSGSFTSKDLALIGATPGVNLAVPLTSINGIVTVGNKTFTGQQIIATTDGFPQVVNQGLDYGQFFSASDPFVNNEAVIGQNLAETLFGEAIPIGQSFSINGYNFRVQGILSPFTTSPLTPITNYNDAIFIPFGVGSQMSGNQPQIYEILAKPNQISQTNATAQAIRDTLSKEYGSQNNFTVLEQKQVLKIANSALDVLTALVATVAAVSLVVGGIGIMNTMLVAVIERTREIGVRKAVGASNKQILSQFLIEAGIIGFIGGVIGVILAALTDVIIAYFSDIRPAMNWEIIVIAISAATLAGLIFGIMPALRAARRDPIESLRHI